jgi:N-acetylglucosaminyldiphosphoundecaprenol N-acetyl-beta-D-mannosaminyltransferase
VPEAPARRRVDVLGCQVDRLTLDEAAEVLSHALADGAYTSQFSVNAAKVVAMSRERRLAAIAAAADLVTADGSSVVLASRLFGDPLPERVTGIDLMHRLFAAAEAAGHPVYVLGSTSETLELALANLRALHPRLQVAGARNGYFGSEDELAVIEGIRTSGARAVIVAMGSPRTEFWIDEHGSGLGAAVVLGVGGSIDVLAGTVKRAPAAFQRMHLEWLYRLAQEPRRLFARNLVSVTFWRMAIARRLSGSAASADRGS